MSVNSIRSDSILKYRNIFYMHLFNAEAGVIPHFKKEKILSSIGFVLKISST
jgi:hypothetical protein